MENTFSKDGDLVTSESIAYEKSMHLENNTIIIETKQLHATHTQKSCEPGGHESHGYDAKSAQDMQQRVHDPALDE
jgi:hypothetical protein